MAINRYNQYSWGKYNPLSFQEMAVLPTQMRQQHDTTAKALAETNLPIEAWDVFQPEARKIKSDFESQVGTTAEELASKGFSPDMTNRVLALNKQRRDLLDPLTGRAGQIIEASKAIPVVKDAFMKSLPKEDSPADAERKWQTYLGEYRKKAYEPSTDVSIPVEQRKINTIQSIMAPGHEDHIQDLLKLKALMGEETRSGKLSNKTQVVPMIDAQGNIHGYGLKTEGGGFTRTTNNKNVQAALDELNLKWTNPEGAGYKYNQFWGITPEYMKQRLAAVPGLMNVDKYTENAQQGITPLAGGATTTDAEPGRVVDTNVDTSPDAAITGKTYQEGRNRLNELNAKHSKTPLVGVNKLERESLLNYDNKVKEILATDGTYKVLHDSRKEALNNYMDKMSTNANYEYKGYAKNNEVRNAVNGVIDGSVKDVSTTNFLGHKIPKYQTSNGKFITGEKANAIDALSRGSVADIGGINDKISKYRDTVYSELRKPTPYYDITFDNADSKLKKSLEGKVADVEKQVTTAPDFLTDNGLITGVQTPEGFKYGLTSDDNKAISQALQYVDKGSLRMTRITQKGKNGFPAIVFSGKLGKNAPKPDLSGWSLNPFSSGSDDIGGEGNNITFEVAVPRVSNIQKERNTLGTNSPLIELFRSLSQAGKEGQILGAESIYNIQQNQ